MKKVLILGGSHRDIPLIEACKKLGFFVITLGDRDYYIGHKYADDYFKVDFNNLERVKSIITKEKIEYILPGSGEASYLNTVAIAKELNLGNYDDISTAKLLHNKWKFKEFCIKEGISTPYGVHYKSSTKNIIKFPMVVKPTDLSGGKGVEVVYSDKELQVALEKAKKVSSEIFLEEYIDGELYAYSVFIKDKKIYYGFLGKDDVYLNKYLITTAYPADLNKSILVNLQRDIEKIVQKLSLVDGMFHLQVLIKNDIAYIIDITRRIPGDLYPMLIEYCDHIAYSQAVVKAYMGLPLKDELISKNKKSFVVRYCVMPNQNGILKGVEIAPSLKDHILFRLDLMQPGNIISNYLQAQVSIFFIRVKNEKEAVNIGQFIRASMQTLK